MAQSQIPKPRIDPSGSVSYFYDSRNLAQKISWTPAGSRKATDYRFLFDPRGLLAEVMANDKSSIRYGFDPLGRLAKLSDGSDAISIEYNLRGLLSKVTDANGRVTPKI